MLPQSPEPERTRYPRRRGLGGFSTSWETAAHFQGYKDMDPALIPEFQQREQEVLVLESIWRKKVRQHSF
jgi:hypothetical protein